MVCYFKHIEATLIDGDGNPLPSVDNITRALDSDG